LEEEIAVNLTANFEIVSRPLTHYVFLEMRGPFPEIAPPAWEEMFPLINAQLDQKQIVSYLGLSTIDKNKNGEEAMIYPAGVGIAAPPKRPLKGLQYRRIEDGKYARFLLTGRYSQIWIAFNQIFKNLAESRVELRPDFCIENYINDPKVTPEDQLQTELCARRLTAELARVLLRKFEAYGDLGFDLYWFAVQKIRAILPLLHSIDRGPREHRVSTEHPDSGD
jgi:DNA gyrase inhibitor GyrI